MKAGAENYAQANKSIIDAINALGKDIGGSTATAGGDAPFWSMGDPIQAAEGNAIPLSNAISGVNDAMAGDFGNLAGDIGNLAANSYQTWIDPLNALVSAGLGFLESFVVPLQRMVAWVTGNPAEISNRKNAWATVRTRLTAMAQEMNQSLSTDLATWEGEASTAAKKRLGDFLDGVHLTIVEISHIEGVLDLSATLMTVALDLVNGILGNLVEWLIITWVAALELAAETGGADIPAAEAASSGEAAAATAEGTEAVSQVARLLQKLQALLRKILSNIKGTAVKNFRNLTADTTHQGVIRTRVLEGLEENARAAANKKGPEPFGGLGLTYAGAGASAVGGLGQSVQDAGGNPFDNPSDTEIDQLLNREG